MMELSEALLSGKIKFEIRPPNELGHKTYRNFQSCVGKAFPEANADTFPLAFSCPLFFGLPGPGPQRSDGRYEPACVIDLIPADVSISMHGIQFLCDVIDCLSVAHGWTEQQVGEWLKKIEAALDAAGMDRYGRDPSAMGGRGLSSL